MLGKLLRKNISVMQIAAYALSSLAGLSIILCALSLYNDVSDAFAGDDSFMTRDYMVISKRVSGLNTMGRGAATDFTQAEIDDIARRPWVRKVGAFTSADFNVRASIDMAGHEMTSYMFLESVPDSFLDVRPSAWQWNESDGTVPVIISKDYLALYNFGFASSQGLPQLSEGLVSSVPLTLTLSGNGRQQSYKAHIVGFSSRLNTIAVPEVFMTYANQLFGHATKAPSRLIVEVNTPGDPAIERFIKQNNYEVAGDKLDNGRANYFLNMLTAVIVTIGAVITLLSFIILILSLGLLLQRNRETLRNLILLGYTPAAVGRPYMLLVLLINVLTMLLSLAVTLAAASWWRPRLQSLGMATGSMVPAIIAALAITVVLSVMTIISLRHRLRALAR